MNIGNIDAKTALYDTLPRDWWVPAFAWHFRFFQIVYIFENIILCIFQLCDNKPGTLRKNCDLITPISERDLSTYLMELWIKVKD